MTRWTISSGSIFEDMAGYCRAVVDGEWIFVSGTAGYDFATGTISPDPAEQARQALDTIAATLRTAGADLPDLVRIRVYVSAREHIPPVCAVLREAFGAQQHKPTNTTIICGFAAEEMKVEIEATARWRGEAGEE